MTPPQPPDVLSPEALAAWDRAAAQATPGPWYAHCPAVKWRVRSNAPFPHRGDFIMEADHVRTPQNAAYIAACSPERVRSLIAAYTASVTEVTRLRAELSAKTDIHILPVGDLHEHKEDRSCWCQPHIDRTDDGRVLVVHSSADGRELIEKSGLQ